MNQVNASRFPAIAFVETIFEDGYRTVGTATLIAPRLLLTAGHVVFDHYRVRNGNVFLASDRASRPREFRVTLGGSVAQRVTISTDTWRSNSKWVNQHSKAPVGVRIRSAFDVGAIILPRPVDNLVGGVFIPQTTDGATLPGIPCDVGGYSAKQFFRSRPRRPLGTMFISDTTNHRILNGFPHRIVYSVNTVPGMSGGPMWSFNSAVGNRTIRGIHTSFINGVGGSALRITNNVLALIQQWQQQTHPAVTP